LAFNGTLDTRLGRTDAWRDSLLVDHAVFRTVWTNFAEVVPGRLYRSNHPTPGHLAAAARRLGLRTLVNLRGQRKCGSDALSRAAAVRLGLVHVDMAFESRGAPHRDRILRFADIYRTLQTPALMHCKSGADRAGLASGLAIMFEGGTAAAEAEGRLPFMEWVRAEYDEVALKRDFVAGGFSSFVTDRILQRE